MALAADFAKVQSAASKTTSPYAERFRLEDSTFTFDVVGRSGKARISCTLLGGPSSYPSTGAYLSCDSSQQQEALAALSESKFSKVAHLSEVVKEALAVFAGPEGGDQQDTDMQCGPSSAVSDRMDVDTAHGVDGAASMDGSDADPNNNSDNESAPSYGDAYEADQASDDGNDGNDDDDDDDQSEEEDKEDKEMLVECGKRQGRWERFEAAKELAEAEQEKGMSAEQAVVKKSQIFDKREAFLMLSRELLTMFKEQCYTMFVDTEQDDVYKWAVELSMFAAGSSLAQDMADIQRKYGYGSVKLSLTFMRDLHPFYPASVEVLRPHFKHWAHGAAASHPMLQLDNWDPLRPQKKFIEQLKTFLETSARVDMECELNDIARYPTSSYTPVERYLAQLEALTAQAPLCVMDVEGSSADARKLYESRGSQRFASEGSASGKKRGRPSGPASEPGAAAGGATSTATAGPAAGTTGVAAGAAGPAAAGTAGGAAGTAAAGAAGAAGSAGPPATAAAPASGFTGAVTAALGLLTGPTAGAAAASAADKQFWARGTGYGHGKQSGEVWDNNASAAQQRARDNELMRVMAALARSIHNELGDVPPPAPVPAPKQQKAAASAPAPATRTRSTRSATAALASLVPAFVNAQEPAAPAPAAAAGSSSAAGSSGAASSSAAGGSNGPTREQAEEMGVPVNDIEEMPPAERELARQYPPNPEACYAALAASCLVPVLVHDIRTTSFGEMCQRQPYYLTLIRLTLQLCRPQLAHLLCLSIPSEGGTCLAKVAAHLNIPARQFIKLTWDLFVSKVKEETKLKAETDPAKKILVATQLKASAETLGELRASMRLALLTCKMAEACEAAAAHHTASATQATASGPGPSSSQAPAPAAQLEETYCNTMRPLQVNIVSLASSAHKYNESATREQVQPGERTLRLGREIAGLSSDLALSYSSSCFVRVDEEHMSMWRALISGPDDTPYAGGCFIFDFYFPPNYPEVCPQVNLKTTGGGSVRFNPNLYNCGKVCLSLLGTWQGGKGEGWLPRVSTANQVLLSIQSLILVPDPYFNEPGYERDMHNEKGKQASTSYNTVIREATVKFAMLDLLKHPPSEFQDVIEAHFRLKKTSILKQMDKWISEGSGSHASSLKSLKSQLEVCFAKL